jgi:hypothetical protein
VKGFAELGGEYDILQQVNVMKMYGTRETESDAPTAFIIDSIDLQTMRHHPATRRLSFA